MTSDPTMRAIRAVRIMSASSDGNGNRLLGVLAGIKLARDHPEAAEKFLIDIGAKMGGESTHFISGLVDYIATGRSSDEHVQHLLEHLPEDE